MGSTISWEDYVLGYCKNVPLPIANSHAQIGQIIFDLIDKSNSNDEFTSEFNKLCAAGSIYKTHQDNMACIQWYLVKSAYENKLAYGRGAFTLVLDTEEKNLRLYAFATGQLGSATDKETIYSRLSSHLHARCGKVQQGCDKGKIDYPGGNTTSLIALSKEKNIFTGEMRPAVYFKMETQGADVMHSPVESILHGVNLIKNIVGAAEIGNLNNYRENAIPQDIKQILLNKFNQQSKNNPNFKPVEIKNLPNTYPGLLKFDLSFKDIIKNNCLNKTGYENGNEIRFLHKNGALCLETRDIMPKYQIPISIDKQEKSGDIYTRAKLLSNELQQEMGKKVCKEALVAKRPVIIRVQKQGAKKLVKIIGKMSTIKRKITGTKKKNGIYKKAN